MLSILRFEKEELRNKLDGDLQYMSRNMHDAYLDVFDELDGILIWNDIPQAIRSQNQDFIIGC